ncbi:MULTISPECIES: flavin monoamine oxidase family protein [Catenuloplanes]|uniref:Monoamine oxidase n=1 Tax=Catenuloplanes niger TaxID=587534 RepID=A0AAE3ZY44_9ACTN|nr:FAD-dependent oxidoreductase [Catenuloplanes niger]MDR7328057.1 monoamine oxidase [Catenuloplanes niger]
MPITASAVTHWADDPWTRGSWSLIGRHGTPADRVTLGTPIRDRIRLTGEATHPTRAGMTHGAHEQGIAAATWATHHGHRDVIVVGAGIAGLAAAQHLRTHGVTAHVLEARHRTGGRTTGTDVGGFTFDLGANWLQQYDHNPLARLAEQLALPVVPTRFASGHDELENELRRRLAAAPAHASVADVLAAWPDPPAALHRLVDTEIVMDTGADLHWLSARHGFEPGVGDGDRWIIGSYQPLVDHLADGLDIHLGTPVRTITDTPHGVTVDGRHTDAVIVTVPIGALPDLTFTPPLPAAHRTALARLGMGRVEKIILRATDRFWPHTPYFRIHGPTDRSISEWLDATDADGTPTLVGLLAGPWLDTLWTGTDHDITTRVLTDVLHAAA